MATHQEQPATYPYEGCGVEVFGLKPARGRTPKQQLENILDTVNYLVIPGDQCWSPRQAKRTDYLVVSSDRHVDGVPISAVIRCDMNRHIQGEVTELSLDWIRGLLVKRLGYECQWLDAPTRGRSAVGYFNIRGPAALRTTSSEDAQALALSTMCRSLASLNLPLANLWNVNRKEVSWTPPKTEVFGHFGTERPSDLQRALTEMPPTDEEGNSLVLSAADRYIAPSYCTDIAVFHDCHQYIPRDYKRHLFKVVTEWNASREGLTGPGPKQGYIRSLWQDKSTGRIVCAPNCCLLAQFICDRVAPSGHYWEFVYQLNSSVSNFTGKGIRLAKERKEAQLEARNPPRRFVPPTTTPFIIEPIPRPDPPRRQADHATTRVQS